MTQRGSSHKPGANSLRWNQTPVSKPPPDPIFHVPPKESKVSKAREARRAQIAYEIEQSMKKRCPMINRRGDHPLYEPEEEA